MTDATIGQGYTLQWGSLEILEARDFTFGAASEELDVTSHSSPIGFKEFIAALSDPGELPFKVNYSEANHGSLLDAQGDSTLVDTLTITGPNGEGPWTADAWVKAYNMSAPVESEQTCDITFRLTGTLAHSSS
jgi:hypothetical protein